MGRREPARWERAPWTLKTYVPAPSKTSVTNLRPTEVMARALLYLWMWSWNFLTSGSLLERRWESSGDGLEKSGSWTLPFKQHLPNIIWFLVDQLRCSFHQCRAPQEEHEISIAPKLETGQSLLKGWCAIGTAIGWTGGGGGDSGRGGGEREGGAGAGGGIAGGAF